MPLSCVYKKIKLFGTPRMHTRKGGINPFILNPEPDEGKVGFTPTSPIPGKGPLVSAE